MAETDLEKAKLLHEKLTKKATEDFNKETKHTRDYSLNMPAGTLKSKRSQELFSRLLNMYDEYLRNEKEEYLSIMKKINEEKEIE